MNVVDKLEKWFNKNHDVLIKFGGLFSVFFLVIFVPIRIQTSISNQLKEQIEINHQLESQIEEMNSDMEFYKTAYAKQQAVQKEVECLARNIYFEAATEPRAGKVAVAEVTMNRYKSGFARSVCGVVQQKNNGICQFSWVCEPKKPISMPAQWHESKEIAENILISQKKYSTMHGALFFHADYTVPGWASTKEFVQKIGRHLFYKG